jgi:OOP family OmpA-OmpF porin
LVTHGVDCKRLIAVGFGGSKPIAPNDSPEHKAENRRTVFVNAALRGHAIGGMPTDGGGDLAGDLCK